MAIEGFGTDVFKMFGLKLGEAHVIRPGGGRAPDALRSLIASEQVLETEEVMIVHHTGRPKPPCSSCLKFNDEPG